MMQNYTCECLHGTVHTDQSSSVTVLAYLVLESNHRLLAFQGRKALTDDATNLQGRGVIVECLGVCCLAHGSMSCSVHVNELLE